MKNVLNLNSEIYAFSYPRSSNFQFSALSLIFLARLKEKLEKTNN